MHAAISSKLKNRLTKDEGNNRTYLFQQNLYPSTHILPTEPHFHQRIIRPTDFEAKHQNSQTPNAKRTASRQTFEFPSLRRREPQESIGFRPWPDSGPHLHIRPAHREARPCTQRRESLNVCASVAMATRVRALPVVSAGTAPGRRMRGANGAGSLGATYTRRRGSKVLIVN